MNETINILNKIHPNGCFLTGHLDSKGNLKVIDTKTMTREEFEAQLNKNEYVEVSE